MHALLLATYSAPLRVCDAVEFNAVDRIERASFAGAADSKKGLFSAWFRFNSVGPAQFLFGNDTIANSRFLVEINAAFNQIAIIAYDAAANLSLSIRESLSLSTGTWYHFIASWDMAVAGSSRIRLNDASDCTEFAFADAALDYTPASNLQGIGAESGAGQPFDGQIAEVYWAPGVYLDLNLVSNRRKFRSASGKPAHLGSDGSLPTGAAPICYQKLDDGQAVANFLTNRGTGGDFAVVNGALATGANSPSD